MIRDDRSPSHPRGKAVTRRHYRYQVQGPNAAKVLEKLNGGPLPDVKFFTMDAINIKGRKVRALRHGMAGAPGLEIWGPYAEGDEIRDAITRSRTRLWSGAGGFARLRQQYAGIRLDSFTPAGGVYRRKDEEIS